MSSLTLRLATDDDGPRIQALVEAAGFAIANVEWTRLYPHWIVAQNGTGVKGCLQVCPGRPIGRLEMLAVDEEATPVERARVVYALLNQGCDTLAEYGSQLSMGSIPFRFKAYKKCLKKRGCVVVNQGNLMAKRLR